MLIIDNPPLSTSERRKRIITQLNSNGSVQVNDLAKEYQVSTVTIRNDLAFLEKQGMAMRAYGGALRCEPNQTVTERTITDKSVLNIQVKQRIGALAATLVKPGARIILDSGTTTLEIARHLREHDNIVVMTNGINVANALLEAQGVELLMTGGQLRRKSLSFYGSQADHALQNYHFDLLFLGVDGIDLERGVTTHHEDEARLNRCMSQVAKQIIVVTDSSKFGKLSLHKIIDTQKIHTLITDDNLPNEQLDELRNMGINVMLVSAN